MLNLHPLKPSLNLVQVFWQQPFGIVCSNFAVDDGRYERSRGLFCFLLNVDVYGDKLMAALNAQVLCASSERKNEVNGVWIGVWIETIYEM